MNAEYIRTMPLDELLPLVKAELKSSKLWREEYDPLSDLGSRISDSASESVESSGQPQIPDPNSDIQNRVWFERTVDLIRHRFFTLKDFSSQGRAYFSEDYDFDPAAVAKNLTKFPYLREWLPELAEWFESMDGPFDEAHIETVVKAFTEEKGTELGVIMNGARTLLTGVAVGPSMLSVFETLGKERTVMRLRSRVGWNS